MDSYQDFIKQCGHRPGDIVWIMAQKAMTDAGFIQRDDFQKQIDATDYMANLIAKARQEALREAMSVYEPYIKLLGAEVDELAPLATLHGWKSGRYEQGVECRKRIEELRLKSGRMPEGK